MSPEYSHIPIHITARPDNLGEATYCKGNTLPSSQFLLSIHITQEVQYQSAQKTTSKVVLMENVILPRFLKENVGKWQFTVLGYKKWSKT